MRRVRNLARAGNNQINPSVTRANNSIVRVREFRRRQREARNQQIREQQQQQQQQQSEQQQQSQQSNLNVSSGTNIDINNGHALTYTNFNLHRNAWKVFENKFKNDSFGWACYVCDRIWFKSDLKPLTNADFQVLQNAFIDIDFHFENNVVCHTCRTALLKKKVPPLAKYNGFSYPPFPNYLPKLDLVSERLISPRLPFMQIRRLRHAQGQFGILGQVINVPVDVNNMVHKLPRQLNDDVCINVHIKRKSTHRSTYLTGLVNKSNIKIWLRYLISTPLFRTHNIEIDHSFFSNEINTNHISQAEVSEEILIDDSLTAQQQTLLWNEDYYLQIAPGERNRPNSLLLDEHAEELSFPTIYLGQFRNFKESVHVTPFMMATSEMRRSDRRGITPHHLLFVAMKIMRLRVRDSLTIAFKHVGKNTNITRQQIESVNYINDCIEHNLAFLKSIPNSAWYWSQRKRDLFAMIRQFGKPTIFLTLSANEIGWVSLLQTLYKLKHNSNITEEEVRALNFIEKSTLVNEDAVTCAMYFNKLVNVLINILRCKRSSPFGKHFVEHFFKRIEFQHRGSPHAHILLWLNEAPSDPLGNDMDRTISLIDSLISVSEAEASSNIKLQKHKHTFTCYKNSVNSAHQKCRFEYPFLPTPSTVILTPMPKENPLYQEYRKLYKVIKLNLENNDYDSFESFYNENNISSDTMYHNIIRAGINRPRVFVKRHPKEKFHNNFNPFILRALQSNTDIQYILEEYSCATYVSEYINKTNRGISNLQRQILNIMDEHPDFSIVEITKNMSVNLPNTVELSSQEAAWYLLREPMSEASTAITYIPTVWPIERERIRKTQKELNEQQLGEDSTNIWKENIFEKYEERSAALENVNLAQFAAYYSKRKRNNGEYYRRQQPKVIRYRNYDINSDMNDFKREMVTLFLPFRNEENDILSDNQFINIYNDNEQTILQNRNEFDAYFDIQKTIQICKDLCRNDDIDQQNTNVVNILPLPNSIQNNVIVNEDLLFASLNKLGAIVKRKENVMTHQDFCNLMRMANEKQQFLLLDVISHVCSSNSTPFQMFFTGPAGCGKTFVIKLLMEIYNRFSATDGFCNAYICCASTGKAAVAIDGVTVHTGFKITLSKPLPLSNEVLQQYRCLFKFVRVIIIDEISMIGAELLSHINMRLQQINGNTLMFGGMDIFLIGDLRQLPPVRATPIFKQIKNSIVGTSLWRSLKYYELDKIMRQSDIAFSSILTKIGNCQTLTENELELIESRFFSIEEVEELCPNGIRLFLENNSVENYNTSVLNTAEEKVISTAKEIYIGCNSTEQEANFRLKAHKMSLIDSGGIPYEITLVINKFYLLTSNIDVSDGLANGAYGKLVHIEYNQEQCVHRVWLEFPNKTGLKLRTKVAAHALASNFSRSSVPISRRTVNIPLNKNKTISVKRNNFPMISACALTIHKSQGGTFNEVVYNYNKNHCQQLLYVALSRVTSISGLYITTQNNDKHFYHGRRQPHGMTDLQMELKRLADNTHVPRNQQLLTILDQSNIIFYTFNCQSLRCHHTDLDNNLVQKSTFLLLSETWLDNTELVQIQNFNCVTQIKREHIRAGGVAIYHNSLSTNQLLYPEEQSRTVSSVGDISIVRCRDIVIGEFIIAVVYISPNNTISNIIRFLHESLLKYSIDGARLLNTNYDQFPFLLAGDFNTNFNSEQSKELIEFMDVQFNLKMNNLVNEPTTRHGSIIDAIFSRSLSIQTELYTSYFSVHKPILSFLNYPPS